VKAIASNASALIAMRIMGASGANRYDLDGGFSLAGYEAWLNGPSRCVKTSNATARAAAILWPARGRQVRMVVRRKSGLVTSNTNLCTLDPFGRLLS
jgi:hypothetical protein